MLFLVTFCLLNLTENRTRNKNYYIQLLSYIFKEWINLYLTSCYQNIVMAYRRSNLKQKHALWEFGNIEDETLNCQLKK